MWRQGLLLAALLSLPAFADSPRVLALLPNGNGATIFALVVDKIVAVPIDASGASHAERAVTLWRDVAEYPSFGIDRTTAGYMMAISDHLQIVWATPLRGDFSAIAQPRAYGSGYFSSLACHDDVCAAAHNGAGLVNHPTLRVIDEAASPLANSPIDPNQGGLVATDDGGFALLLRLSAPSQGQLVLQFFDRAGHLTATSTVATRNGTENFNFYGVSIAPHPLGVAVFWPDGPQVAAAIVRTDGVVIARAAFVAPDIEVSSVRVAHGAGQYGLKVTTVVEPGFYVPQNPNNRAPTVASNVMRVSDSLSLLESPVRVGDFSDGITAADDAFFALIFDGAYRLLRIPYTGPIKASSSKLLDFAPLVRRRTASR
jgi:hypothetical protein